MRKKMFLLFLTISLAFAMESYAQTVQWRGPNRDGHFPAQNLKKMWGPELLLKVDKLGKGHSSVIYQDGIMFITGMKDTLDVLSALNMEGELLWETVYGTAWRKSFPDTRSTPTFCDGKLYVTSGIGELVCVDAEKGKILWKVNVDKDYKAEWSRFGVSESPLVYKDIVISCPGGSESSIVAFDKNTGKEVWKTDSIGGKRIYSSPTLYSHDGKEEVLALTSQYLICLDPADGKVVWKFKNPFEKFREGPYTNTPIYKGDEIFMSHGYDYPAFMLKVSPDSVYMKWTDTIFDNHHHGYVLHDGYIYGSNWDSNKKGYWICMDWESGRVKYEYDWGTKGTIIEADSMLYIYEEKSGMIGLLKPNPSKFDLQSSFKITDGSGPHWAHLSIYQGMMFVRHGEVLMVYKI
jgi:outer membrane protein assembly factor BamB